MLTADPAARKSGRAAGAVSSPRRSWLKILRRWSNSTASFLALDRRFFKPSLFLVRGKNSIAPGYGAKTEEINRSAVRLAREVSGDKALVAGSVSRTQLFEREGRSSADHVRDLISEQIRLLKDSGIDFLILETFFHLEEMLIALSCAASLGVPSLATMSFRPTLNLCSDGHAPQDCAKAMADGGALAVGANCEQEPSRMLHVLRAMRSAVAVPLIAQPAAFRTTDATPCFTKLPEFPDGMETIQVNRTEFHEFGRRAVSEGIAFVGGCCGCNAAYIRALKSGVEAAA